MNTKSTLFLLSFSLGYNLPAFWMVWFGLVGWLFGRRFMGLGHWLRHWIHTITHPYTHSYVVILSGHTTPFISSYPPSVNTFSLLLFGPHDIMF